MNEERYCGTLALRTHTEQIAAQLGLTYDQYRSIARVVLSEHMEEDRRSNPEKYALEEEAAERGLPLYLMYYEKLLENNNRQLQEQLTGTAETFDSDLEEAISLGITTGELLRLRQLENKNDQLRIQLAIKRGRVKPESPETAKRLKLLQNNCDDAEKRASAKTRSATLFKVVSVFLLICCLALCFFVYSLSNGSSLITFLTHDSINSSAANVGPISTDVQSELINSHSQDNTIMSGAQTLSFRVAGVTFKNPDGTDRQRTLASFYRSNGGSGSGAGRLSRYTYQGSPAIYVLLNNKVIGNIPADDVSSVLSIYNEIDEVSIFVDRFFSDEGELIYFARVSIEY